MAQSEQQQIACAAESDAVADMPPSLDEADAAQLARLFSALSDHTRVRIIATLLRGECCVHVLTKALGMSQSAISHQLATLRDLRLVKGRKDGRHVYYALDDDHIHTLFQQGLDHVQHA